MLIFAYFNKDLSLNLFPCKRSARNINIFMVLMFLKFTVLFLDGVFVSNLHYSAYLVMNSFNLSHYFTEYYFFQICYHLHIFFLSLFGFLWWILTPSWDFTHFGFVLTLFLLALFKFILLVFLYKLYDY